MAESREVNLAELAARAAERETLTLQPRGAGKTTAARGGSTCRNIECRKGLTPGLVAIGGGDKGRPLFGEGGTGAKRLMRWAWVRCLACNPPDDARKAGAVFKRLNLSHEEIEQRAQLATTRAPYTLPQERKPVPVSRGGIYTAPTPSAAASGRLAELLETNKKLTEQVTQLTQQLTQQGSQFLQTNETLSRMTVQIASLLEDNAKLRRELEASRQPAKAPGLSDWSSPEGFVKPRGAG